MNPRDIKALCFEYILFQLIMWLDEVEFSHNSLTRLKALKLLFFISTIRDKEGSKDLLDVFDNYWAMQHGPVESDIYNMIVRDNLTFYDFKSRVIHQKKPINEFNFNQLGDLKKQVKESITLLRKKNKNIIKYSAFELVNLSHKWNCWQLSMHIAELSGRGSERMRKQDIRTDNQYYSL